MAGPGKSAKPNAGPKTKAKAKAKEEEEAAEVENWKRLRQNMHCTMNRAVRKAREGDDYKKASPEQQQQLEEHAKDKIEEK